MRLIDRERERFGVSRGEWARGVISTHLFQSEKENVTGQLEELHDLVQSSGETLKSHDRKLAAALFTILTAVGEMDADEAKALVRRRILGGEGSQ